MKRDRLAVRSGLEFATRKTPMDYFGSGFTPSQNRSLYKFSHGIQAPNLLPPSMVSQLGFSAYMQRNHGSPSNMKHGQCCCCPSMCLHGLNHTAMDFNAEDQAMAGVCSIMPLCFLHNHGCCLHHHCHKGKEPTTGPLPVIPKPMPGFYMRNGGKKLFPK